MLETGNTLFRYVGLYSLKHNLCDVARTDRYFVRPIGRPLCSATWPPYGFVKILNKHAVSSVSIENISLLRMKAAHGIQK